MADTFAPPTTASPSNDGSASAGQAGPSLHLLTLLNSLPDAIVFLDREWHITYANEEARRISRMTPDYLHGKTHWELYPETIGTPLEAAYRRAMATQQKTSIEYCHQPFNVWLDINIIPTGEGLALCYRDITDRRAAEQTVREQQERLIAIKQFSRLATWDIELATGEIRFGEGSFAVYGRPLSSVKTVEDLDEIIVPAHLPRIRQIEEAAVRTGKTQTVEFQVIGPDGAPIWLESRIHAIADHTAPVRLRGMTLDIDSRKRGEEETEHQRAELETLYRTAPIGLALFDPVEFRYLRLNDRQAEIIGLPPEKILGRTLTEIAPIPGLHELFEQARDGNPIQAHLLEGVLPAQPEEYRYWNVNYFPVYDSDGTVRAITAASLEVTQQKKSELALIQSEKLAAVGRLASSISHEINNPLEAITNLLFLIALDEGLAEQTKTYVRIAQGELARVSQIATQTLRFHRQAANPTLVTASNLVDAVLRLYQGRLANSGIRVEAHYSSKTPILCFENDIRQVLNNLIGNAIDAMRTGGRLIVRAHDTMNFPTGQHGVRITVADTGHGMTRAVLERIFEPFYTTKELNGTGLGLWISTGIMEHHHGRIAVRSSRHPIHHGTVFSLFLPATKPE